MVKSDKKWKKVEKSKRKWRNVAAHEKAKKSNFYKINYKKDYKKNYNPSCNPSYNPSYNFSYKRKERLYASLTL